MDDACVYMEQHEKKALEHFKWKKPKHPVFILPPFFFVDSFLNYHFYYVLTRRPKIQSKAFADSHREWAKQEMEFPSKEKEKKEKKMNVLWLTMHAHVL